MTTVSSIVEGHGEVAAMPVLLRRLATHFSPQTPVSILKPTRVPRDKFLNRDNEFARYLKLAASECGADGWIMLLLDADDDCPVTCSHAILQKAKEIISCRISVIMANREYEAWFVASASSLHGKRGFTLTDAPPSDPEAIHNAKGWIADRMLNRGYGETTDQPAFSAAIDIDMAQQNSRSFRKLCDEWKKNMLK